MSLATAWDLSPICGERSVSKLKKFKLSNARKNNKRHETLRGLNCVSQKTVLIEYKGFTREEPLRFDVLVEGCALVEAKAVERTLPIHKAQLPELHEIAECPAWAAHQFP